MEKNHGHKVSSDSLGYIDMLYHSENILNSGLNIPEFNCYTVDIRENLSSIQTSIAICSISGRNYDKETERKPAITLILVDILPYRTEASITVCTRREREYHVNISRFVVFHLTNV
jgi:hypothetical protein